MPNVFESMWLRIKVERHLIDTLHYAADWDESKVNRDEDGRFADKPRSKAARAREEKFRRQPSTGSHDDIGSLVKDAKNNAREASSYLREYAPVSGDEAKRLKEATGIDFFGYAHSIDGSAVNHIFRRHGEGNETRDGHLPINEDDISKVPEVIAADQKSGSHRIGTQRRAPYSIYPKDQWVLRCRRRGAATAGTIGSRIDAQDNV